MRQRTVSAVPAIGNIHIGNYTGMLKPCVSAQSKDECYFMVADLHGIISLRVGHNPAALRKARLHTAATLLAVGLDPEKATLFFQSDIPQHTELMWYLAAAARRTELEHGSRPTDQSEWSSTTANSFAGSILLMAADILLYAGTSVPVGVDQVGQVEMIARWATRFNDYCGTQIFQAPKATVPRRGGRVMDLRRPSIKMSKSTTPSDGVIFLTDNNTTIARKINSALTDRGGPIYRSRERPGITNLIELYSALTDIPALDVENLYVDLRYEDLKLALIDLTVEIISPIRARIYDYSSDPGEVWRTFQPGRDRALITAGSVCDRARTALGLNSK